MAAPQVSYTVREKDSKHVKKVFAALQSAGLAASCIVSKGKHGPAVEVLVKKAFAGDDYTVRTAYRCISLGGPVFLV